MNIKGIIPALITPMHEDGQVNYHALKMLVNKLIEDGADAFYVCGSTGECFMLEDSERKKIVETVTCEVNGRVPVIAQVGAIWEGKAVELAKHAEQCGVTAVSSVPPFYYRFTMQEIASFYQNISDAIEIPIIIYNIPDFTGVSINASNIGSIVQRCRIGGLKYTDYNLFEMERIRRRFPDIKIYNGHDECMVNALPLGIAGSIGSTFNIMTPFYKQIESLFQAGKILEAMQIQKKVNGMIDILLSTSLFPAIKHIASLGGIACGPCRKPFSELSLQQKQQLQAMFEKLNQ